MIIIMIIVIMIILMIIMIILQYDDSKSHAPTCVYIYIYIYIYICVYIYIYIYIYTCMYRTGGQPAPIQPSSELLATNNALWNFCSQRVSPRKPAKTNKKSYSTDFRSLFANYMRQLEFYVFLSRPRSSWGPAMRCLTIIINMAIII